MEIEYRVSTAPYVGPPIVPDSSDGLQTGRSYYVWQGHAAHRNTVASILVFPVQCYGYCADVVVSSFSGSRPVLSNYDESLLVYEINNLIHKFI